MGVPVAEERRGEHVAELVHQSLVPANMSRDEHDNHDDWLTRPRPPVRHPDVGDVGPLDAVARHARPEVLGAEPVLLGGVREPGLEHGVARHLAQVAAAGQELQEILSHFSIPGEFPDLSRDAVLLHEGLLGEVELERVIRGQRDVEAAGEVVRERGAGVVQEQRVVGQRRHRDAWAQNYSSQKTDTT